MNRYDDLWRGKVEDRFAKVQNTWNALGSPVRRVLLAGFIPYDPELLAHVVMLRWNLLTVGAQEYLLTLDWDVVLKKIRNLNEYAAEVHRANQKWWQDLNTGEPLDRNFGELIALCHSELSEALEGHRKNLMDDKVPHRKMEEVELVDCMIRIFDIAGGLGMDLQGAYEDKMAYNSARPDYQPEARRMAGGKKY